MRIKWHWLQLTKLAILKNVFYNIMASILPSMILQLLLYPCYSNFVSQKQYGDMITTLSVLTIIAMSAGNALNNVRLLQQNKYSESEQQGDYLIILLLEVLLVVISTTIILFFFIRLVDLQEIVLTILLSILMTIQSYAVVAFIQNLDYKRVLINNIFLLAGYGIGFLLCILCDKKWQYIYIIGYLFSIFYIQKASHIFSENLIRTKLYKETVYKTCVLSLASLIASGNNYLDRILLSPMLGAESVTIYYISTLMGKTLGMVISPVNNVILAYLAKQKKGNYTIEKLAMLFSWIFMGTGCVVCIIVSRFIIPILYPTYYVHVKQYILINTITAMIINTSSMISPFLLKWCSANWQILINSISLVFMVIFSLIGYMVVGLYGYSIGILLYAILKYFIQFIVLKLEKQKE